MVRKEKEVTFMPILYWLLDAQSGKLLLAIIILPTNDLWIEIFGTANLITISRKGKKILAVAK